MFETGLRQHHRAGEFSGAAMLGAFVASAALHALALGVAYRVHYPAPAVGMAGGRVMAEFDDVRSVELKKDEARREVLDQKEAARGEMVKRADPVVRAVPDAVKVEPVKPPEVDRDWEFRPGIRNGADAKEATAWLGYDRYEEQLAALAEIEQAAFTSTHGLGDPLSESEEEAARAAAVVGSGETSATGDSGVRSEPATANLNDDSAAATEAMEPVISEEAVREVVEEVSAAVEALRQTADGLGRRLIGAAATPAKEKQVSASAVAEIEAVERARRLQDEAGSAGSHAKSSDESFGPAESPGSTASAEMPHGEPNAADAAASEINSQATSTRDVPEAAWRIGKPLAVEGAEITPYPLYRHIVIDSRDTLFARQWNGRMKQNPIVALQFDRFGRVGAIDVIRYSGHEEFDRKYLVSWMTRWRARDPKLREMKEGELSPAVRFRLVFIDELEERRDGSAGSN